MATASSSSLMCGLTFTGGRSRTPSASTAVAARDHDVRLGGPSELLGLLLRLLRPLPAVAVGVISSTPQALNERQGAAPEPLGGDRVVLGGQRRVGEQVTGAGVVEHLDGAPPPDSTSPTAWSSSSCSRQGSARVECVWAGTPAGHLTLSPNADTGMVPATNRTPDTLALRRDVHRHDTAEREAGGHEAVGQLGDGFAARCMSTACPTSFSAKLMAGG
jgi:hypothetical protein